jgi:hypothetical protein
MLHHAPWPTTWNTGWRTIRFAKTSQDMVASQLALACALGPLAPDDAAALAALAPRTTQARPKLGMNQLGRGAAHLRLGQH